MVVCGFPKKIISKTNKFLKLFENIFNIMSIEKNDVKKKTKLFSKIK